jgi:hypothetical protein
MIVSVLARVRCETFRVEKTAPYWRFVRCLFQEELMHAISRCPQDILAGSTNRDCVFVDSICRYCLPWLQGHIVCRKCKCWSHLTEDEYRNGREDTE